MFYLMVFIMLLAIDCILYGEAEEKGVAIQWWAVLPGGGFVTYLRWRLA